MFQLKNKNGFEPQNGDKGSFDKDLADIASGAGISFVGKITSAVVQYVYLIVISKILGVHMLGGVVLGTTIISLSGIVCRLGLDFGVVKFVSQYTGQNNLAKAVQTITVALIVGSATSLFIGLLISFNSHEISLFFGNKKGLKEVLTVFALTIPFTTIMLIALGATQGVRIMKYTAYAQNFSLHIINLSAVILFCYFGFELKGIISAFFIASLLACLLSIYFLLKTFKAKNFSFSIQADRELFSVSIPLGLVFFLSCIVLWTDTIMLGYFKSSVEVGIYNTAIKTALLLSLVYASFNTIFTPIIAELYCNKEMVRLEGLYKIVAKWIFLMTLPLFLLVALLSKEIMQIFGLDFLPGSQPLIVISFSFLTMASVGSTGYLLAMTGRHMLVLFNTTGTLVINFFLNYYMIPRYGINGAAYATSLSHVLVNFISIAEVFVILKMHPFSSRSIRPILIGSFIFCCLFLIKQNTQSVHYLIDLILYSFVFLLLFFISFYKWCLAEEDDFILQKTIGKFSQFIK